MQPDQTWGAAAAARERGRRPLNPATCLHNLTILTIPTENTHNTHMPNRSKADSHILLLLLFSPRACEFNLTPGEHGELRGPSELLFFLSRQLLPVSGIPQFTLFSRCRGARVPFCLSWPRHCRRSWWLLSNGSHFPPPSHLSRPGTDLAIGDFTFFSRKFVKRQSNHFPPILCHFPSPLLCILFYSYIA